MGEVLGFMDTYVDIIAADLYSPRTPRKPYDVPGRIGPAAVACDLIEWGRVAAFLRLTNEHPSIYRISIQNPAAEPVDAGPLGG